MKPRNNPSDKQILRRLKQLPESRRDPRFRNDAYMALRVDGKPHSYAKRALRDVLPELRKHVLSDETNDYDVDPEDILLAHVTTSTLNVVIRPSLTQEIADTLGPRDAEYTIWDENVQGFGLRVRASGFKSYIYLYKDKCRRLHKKTLGNARKLSLESARDHARIMRDQLAECDPDGQFEVYARDFCTCHTAQKTVLDSYPTITPMDEELDVDL